MVINYSCVIVMTVWNKNVYCCCGAESCARETSVRTAHIQGASARVRATIQTRNFHVCD